MRTCTHVHTKASSLGSLDLSPCLGWYLACRWWWGWDGTGWLNGGAPEAAVCCGDLSMGATATAAAAMWQLWCLPAGAAVATEGTPHAGSCSLAPFPYPLLFHIAPHFPSPLPLAPSPPPSLSLPLPYSPLPHYLFSPLPSPKPHPTLLALLPLGTHFCTGNRWAL